MTQRSPSSGVSRLLKAQAKPRLKHHLNHRKNVRNTTRRLPQHHGGPANQHSYAGFQADAPTVTTIPVRLQETSAPACRAGLAGVTHSWSGSCQAQHTNPTSTNARPRPRPRNTNLTSWSARVRTPKTDAATTQPNQRVRTPKTDAATTQPNQPTLPLTGHLNQ